MSDTDAIRSLNDRFRAGDASVPGQVFFTRGLADLLEESGTSPLDLMHPVRTFDAFTPDNDPHREHDFGSFEFLGHTCFWKIDVMDPSLEMAPLDPADPQFSVRVLTVMLAEEY